jgi:hypothetical protein
MDFNATIDLIIKDLNEAREIIDDLKKYPGVPALQVEFAKSKCKSAAEVIALIKTMGEIVPEVRQEAPQLKIKAEVKTEPEALVIEVAPKVIVRPKEKKKETVSEELTQLTGSKKEEAKKIPEKIADAPIIADRFTDISDSFHDKLLEQKKNDDVSVFQKVKQISSLAEAIGLNDRFLYIREIFNGDKEKYGQAISHLDDVKTIADARAVIMSYTGNSNENDAVVHLLDLIKRKLSADE